MSATTETPRRPFTVFAIPEEAHLALVQMGHHARLMAELTAIGTQASKHDARLRPDALSWNFSRMAKELDDIIAVSYFSTELVNAYEAAHKERKKRDSKET